MTYHDGNKLVILSARGTNPPAANSSARDIPGGPLYPVTEVLAVLDQGEQVLKVWTRKCAQDLQALTFDADAALRLVRDALTSGRFKGAEWCTDNGYSWAACDAYTLRRNEWVPVLRREEACNYYVKFAIGKTGKLLLLVSCHLSS